MLFTIADPSQDEPNLLDLVVASQSGDSWARNKIINKYKPFIYKTASKVSGNFIDYSSDEASIGLIAFNEAIDYYDPEKGASFFTFAEVVIKRRLIDFYRKEQKSSAISFSSLSTELCDGEFNALEFKESDRIYKWEQEKRDRQEEMLYYSAILRDYGISMGELVKISPKHVDARMRAMEVAQVIAEDDTLKEFLLVRKELPLKALESKVKIRQRKYVIALTIILICEFPMLKEYIQPLMVGRGSESV